MGELFVHIEGVVKSMGKQASGHEDNLILFPGLVTKLVEKGMTSLKEKKYYDALKFFQQSLELEPSHPQARYGLVITNIELNCLEKAREHCESMLNEGIGSYYEVLQVYVSLLVQLGDYENVQTLLEGVIQEEKLPPNMAESFYQLLEFSRSMTSSSNIKDPIVDSDDSIEAITNNEEWIKLLERGKPEQQWGAIQKLSHSNTKEVHEACKNFLKGKDNNPVLKSYILQMLKELNIKDTLEVSKFGETYHINIEELENVFHERFGNEVIKQLEDELGQESPSLFEMVQQVWWHYLFALYPKSPTPLDSSVWSACLHVLGADLMGEDKDTTTISNRYGVKEEVVEEAVEHMKGIESQLFQVQNDYT